MVKLEMDVSGEHAAQLRECEWRRLWEKCQAWNSTRGLGSDSRGPGEDVCAIQLPWLSFSALVSSAPGDCFPQHPHYSALVSGETSQSSNDHLAEVRLTA